MLVALYQSHHELPWWGGKTNPFDIFSPEVHRTFPFKGGPKTEEVNSQTDRTVLGYEKITLGESKHLFSFLSGLHAVETDHLMAHVSAMCSCELETKGWWHYPKRIWVQITTRPDEFAKGLPIVYDMVGKLKQEIRHVWGGDNGTHSPYEFFSTEEMQERASNNPDIWTRFFVEQLGLDPKLKALKIDVRVAEKLLKEVTQEVRQVQVFGKECLNTNLNVTFNVC